MRLTDLRRQLIEHEGLRLKPYKDTVGKLTIGVGRNLADRGVTEEEAMHMLDTDIRVAEADARELVPNFDDLGDTRQHVIIDMAFNLGRVRLGRFRKMLSALNRHAWSEAADEMVNSRWYQQVGTRGVRLERMMRTGEP